MTTSIVSDSSPLISFARAKKLYLIQGVYEKIIIPPEVYEEIVVKGKDKPGGEEIKAATWVSVQRPQNQSKVDKLKRKFGLGESEAIVLADEWSVIREARRRGLKITSTHLTLEKAKDRGLIRSIKKELDELIASGFRTTPELIKETLQKAGELANL